jgi:hypothetical protein
MKAWQSTEPVFSFLLCIAIDPRKKWECQQCGMLIEGSLSQVGTHYDKDFSGQRTTSCPYPVPKLLQEQITEIMAATKKLLMLLLLLQMLLLLLHR